MALQDYYNRETGDDGDEDLPNIPIETQYPLEEWVVVKSHYDGRKRYVDGEDYDGNWVVEFRELDSGECRVAVYPPDHNPDHDHHPTIGWTDESEGSAKETFDRAIRHSRHAHVGGD